MNYANINIPCSLVRKYFKMNKNYNQAESVLLIYVFVILLTLTKYKYTYTLVFSSFAFKLDSNTHLS